MYYPVSALLIEFLILSVVDTQDSYGYEISQTVKIVADIKESTLYPILKKLEKNRNFRDVNASIILSPIPADNNYCICTKNGFLTEIQLTELLKGGFEIDQRRIYGKIEKTSSQTSQTGL